MLPFFVTIPHSGEMIPDFCTWLKNLPEPVLMRDVDRFVDRLYRPALESLGVDSISTQWHRYAADLNRVPDDIDQSSVLGAKNPAGQFSRGFHWVMTTLKEPLILQPMSEDMHQKLIQLIYDPFHANIENQYKKMFNNGSARVFHLDAHSMPGMGTSEHRDPGQQRTDIVISDSQGKSCSDDYLDLVVSSYLRAGFRVGYNWPYYGGRLTEAYGRPDLGQEVLQVELNRSLYMDEDSKKIKDSEAQQVSVQLQRALGRICEKLPLLK